MANINKRLVDSLKPDPEGDIWAWDDKLKGFGVRVKPSGHKSYMVQYRSQGRTRRVTIGAHGKLTAEQARKQARILLAEVDKGGNPAEDRSMQRKAVTVKELADRYLREHAGIKKKPASAFRDQRLIERFILPELGSTRVEALTRVDVARLHNRIGRDTPIQANRTLAVLSKMMTLAISWGLGSGDNPCKYIQRFKENKRERYLSAEELATLGKVLSEVERKSRISPYAVAAIRFLLLSGARVGEVLGMRWEWVDFERSCVFLPDSKTGKKVIPLGGSALELLEGLPKMAGNPYVFPGKAFGSPIYELSGTWERIRKVAGLDGVRIHDLRHSWASQAAAAGLSLPFIGAILGHTEPTTTARYSHLANDPLKAAADMVAEKITEAMSKQPVQKVVKLPNRG
ncbi:MAG: site-specific integrase [Deltaproteobacteria bacterium]|nr:site-specific integrase [Deltaproteobacteria bacterium]